MKKSGTYLILAVLILFVAAGLRLPELSAKAVHHDESVNYSFTKKLHDKFQYKYNPSAYHGPFLYFAALPFYSLLGASKVSIRLMPVIFGILMVLALLMMHGVIGKPGALLAALVVAISPIDVYFSRTFIHQVYLSAFTTGAIWAFLSFAKKANLRALFGFCICIALCLTIKETTAILMFCLILAYVATRLFFIGMPYQETEEDCLLIDWGFLREKKLLTADAVGLALTIWILLFTTFLTYPEGLLKFFEAFMPWAKTGFKESGHNKHPVYFSSMMLFYYAPILLPALVTGVWSLLKQKPRGIFLFLLSMFMLFIYSVIPYKTPWCLMQIGVPFIILAGYGLSKALAAEVPHLVKAHAAGVVLILCVPFAWYSYVINFVEYDNDDFRIVYVQTDRSYEDMVDLIARMAKRSGLGNKLPIAMVDAKNPARFYLHPYKRVKKYEDVPEDEMIEQKVILVNSEKEEELRKQLPGLNWISLSYPVWPGTYTNLLVDGDFYDNYAKGDE